MLTQVAPLLFGIRHVFGNSQFSVPRRSKINSLFGLCVFDFSRPLNIPVNSTKPTVRIYCHVPQTTDPYYNVSALKPVYVRVPIRSSVFSRNSSKSIGNGKKPTFNKMLFGVCWIDANKLISGRIRDEARRPRNIGKNIYHDVCFEIISSKTRTLGFSWLLPNEPRERNTFSMRNRTKKRVKKYIVYRRNTRIEFG